MSLSFCEHRLIGQRGAPAPEVPTESLAERIVEFMRLPGTPEQLEALVDEVRRNAEKGKIVEAVHVIVDSLRQRELLQIDVNLQDLKSRTNELLTTFGEKLALGSFVAQLRGDVERKKAAMTESPVSRKGEGWYGRTLDAVGWNRLQPETKSRIKAAAVGAATVLGVVALWKFGKWLFGKTKEGAEKTKEKASWLGRTLLIGAGLALAGAAAYFGFLRLERFIEEKVAGPVRRQIENAQEYGAALKHREEELHRALAQEGEEQRERVEQLIGENARLQQENAKRIQEFQNQLHRAREAREGKEKTSSEAAEATPGKDEPAKQKPERPTEDGDDGEKKRDLEQGIESAGEYLLERGLLALYPPSFIPREKVLPEQVHDVIRDNQEVALGDVLKGVTASGREVKSIALPEGIFALPEEDRERREYAARYVMELCIRAANSALSVNPNMLQSDLHALTLGEILPSLIEGAEEAARVAEHVVSSGGDPEKLAASLRPMELLRSSATVRNGMKEMLVEHGRRLREEEGVVALTEDVLRRIDPEELLALAAKELGGSPRGFLERLEQSLETGDAVRPELLLLREVLQGMDMETPGFLLPFFHDLAPYGDLPWGTQEEKIQSARTILMSRMNLSQAVSLHASHRLAKKHNPIGLLLAQVQVFRYVTGRQERADYRRYLKNVDDELLLRIGRDVTGGGWEEWAKQWESLGVDIPPETFERARQMMALLTVEGAKAALGIAGEGARRGAGVLDAAVRTFPLAAGGSALGAGMGFRWWANWNVDKELVKEGMERWRGRVFGWRGALEKLDRSVRFLNPLAFDASVIDNATMRYKEIYVAWERATDRHAAKRLSDAVNDAIVDVHQPSKWQHVASVLDDLREPKAAAHARDLAMEGGKPMRKALNRMRFYRQEWWKKPLFWMAAQFDQVVEAGKERSGAGFRKIRELVYDLPIERHRLSKVSDLLRRITLAHDMGNAEALEQLLRDTLFKDEAIRRLAGEGNERAQALLKFRAKDIERLSAEDIIKKPLSDILDGYDMRVVRAILEEVPPGTRARVVAAKNILGASLTRAQEMALANAIDDLETRGSADALRRAFSPKQLERLLQGGMIEGEAANVLKRSMGIADVVGEAAEAAARVSKPVESIIAPSAEGTADAMKMRRGFATLKKLTAATPAAIDGLFLVYEGWQLAQLWKDVALLEEEYGSVDVFMKRAVEAKKEIFWHHGKAFIVDAGTVAASGAAIFLGGKTLALVAHPAGWIVLVGLAAVASVDAGIRESIAKKSIHEQMGLWERIEGIDERFLGQSKFEQLYELGDPYVSQGLGALLTSVTLGDMDRSNRTDRERIVLSMVLRQLKDLRPEKFQKLLMKVREETGIEESTHKKDIENFQNRPVVKDLLLPFLADAFVEAAEKRLKSLPTATSGHYGMWNAASGPPKLSSHDIGRLRIFDIDRDLFQTRLTEEDVRNIIYDAAQVLEAWVDRPDGGISSVEEAKGDIARLKTEKLNIARERMRDAFGAHADWLMRMPVEELTAVRQRHANTLVDLQYYDHSVLWYLREDRERLQRQGHHFVVNLDKDLPLLRHRLDALNECLQVRFRVPKIVLREDQPLPATGPARVRVSPNEAFLRAGDYRVQDNDVTHAYDLDFPKRTPRHRDEQSRWLQKAKRSYNALFEEFGGAYEERKAA